MSGIVGFVNKNGTVDTLNALKRMLTQIKHRGSDYNGVYISNCIGLGEGRISSSIKQTQKAPISNEDETLWIVWSGSVFNPNKLKSKLLDRGCQLKTDCDAELVLLLYQEFGMNSLNMINGQFAFSIWDVIKNELFIARDRVGICPLYYSMTTSGFVFASEMKALFEHPQLVPNISTKSLTQIATFWTTLTPNTIFEGVSELSPGHYLILNSDGLKSKAYWEFPVYLPEEYSEKSLAKSIDQFDELFSDAVAIRTEQDEPYGTYLSGGIDSSVTTAYIKKLHPGLNLDTFSISFTNPDFDESPYQDIAIDYYKTNHSKVICSDADIANNFKETVWHAETPLLRSAPTPMFLLSKLARKSNIKTVITGEGADEILGGYNIFKESIIREFWAKEPKSKYRPLLLKKLYPYLAQMSNTNDMALKMFFGYKLTETSSPVYSHLLRWNNTARIKNFFSSNLKDEIRNYNPVEEFSEKIKAKLKGVDLLSRAQWLEATIFMSSYLLSSQGERMVAANSVEARAPFLDHRVIELCMKLRPEYKLKGLNEKYLLKTMMRNRVPNDIIDRKKQPYRAPIASSFSSDNAPDYIQDMLSKEKIVSTGFFDYEKVKLLLDKMKLKHQITEIDNMALTAILSTQILQSCFSEKRIKVLKDSELIQLDNIVYDKSVNYA
ncbi:MAG: asparagine synthase (glutamine-hydrolyzing) [Bacteroidales bacterium]|nr:asparagine synthase (glutamine-hydrolyzing) [Bacteroidales bacterium]